MNDSDIRLKFEVIAVNGELPEVLDLEQYGSGVYVSATTNIAWRAFRYASKDVPTIPDEIESLRGELEEAEYDISRISSSIDALERQQLTPRKP